MAQPRTPRNTIPTSTTTTQSGGGTAVATRPGRGPAPTHEQISRRAHEIWIKRGCKPGQDEQNWLDAEAQLKAEMTRK